VIWLWACSGGPAPDTSSAPLVVVTMNSGTTPGQDFGANTDGYGEDQASASDAWYGDGLAWEAAVVATEAFFTDTAPQVVGFQEVFDTGGCDEVPDEARDGFVCSTWTAGDPTVAERVLGSGFEVVCHPGHPDKCVGVSQDVGGIAPMAGVAAEGCGSGARVAYSDLELADGPLRVIHVHGTSGLSDDDIACRLAQVAQVEQALGERNLVLGDLNTDPARFAGYDASAAAWTELADRAGLRWHTELGDDAEPTYSGVANIDHVLTDWAEGRCEARPFYDQVYFDHVPLVCSLS